MSAPKSSKKSKKRKQTLGRKSRPERKSYPR